MTQGRQCGPKTYRQAKGAIDMNTEQHEALRLAEMLTADEWPGSVTLVSYAREF